MKSWPSVSRSPTSSTSFPTSVRTMNACRTSTVVKLSSTSTLPTCAGRTRSRSPGVSFSVRMMYLRFRKEMPEGRKPRLACRQVLAVPRKARTRPRQGAPAYRIDNCPRSAGGAHCFPSMQIPILVHLWPPAQLPDTYALSARKETSMLTPKERKKVRQVLRAYEEMAAVCRVCQIPVPDEVLASVSSLRAVLDDREGDRS